MDGSLSAKCKWGEFLMDYLVTDTELTSVADAIRTKGGTSANLSFPTEFVSAINDISTGASNVVFGEFHTDSTAGADTITIPYTGSGYPIACIVYIKYGAYNPVQSNWYNSVQRYAVGQWTMTKSVTTQAPTYTTSGTANQGVTTAIYKNSTSSSTSYTRTSGMNTNVFSSSNASNAALTCVRFKSSTQMSVYTNTSSYGLLPSMDYSYIIIYSD